MSAQFYICRHCGNIIENNFFDGLTMASVSISNDCNNWYESGHVENMVIRNNDFKVKKPPVFRGAKPAILIEPILLEHYVKYPKMELVDFIKLIYQNSFGPRHMHTPTKEMVTKYINDEMNSVTRDEEFVEEIGNGYVRVYLSKNTNTEKLIDSFLGSMNIDTYTEQNIRIFYRKINVLINLIKKGRINLPKKESIDYIKEYLSNGINPVRHSKIYNELYKPHYRVIKK